MAARNFNSKQALEKEVKDLWAEFSPGSEAVAATATLDLSTDIVLTSAAAGASRNTTTFELIVNAPAANPTDTVLVDFSGDADAIVCTVTPNDGTNNAATPVSLDEDELAELINTGAVAGKTITLTDGDDLRELQTATGGAAADALTSGDDQVATFADGANAVAAAFVSGHGFESVERTDIGEFLLTLQDKYTKLRSADAILKGTSPEDVQWQISADAIASDAQITMQALVGASPVTPVANVMVKLELKIAQHRCKMMMDDKKKISTVILAKMGKPSEDKPAESEDGAEQDASLPKDAAADELLAAIEAKSAKGIVEAFESLMELCAPSSYEE